VSDPLDGQASTHIHYPLPENRTLYQRHLPEGGGKLRMLIAQGPNGLMPNKPDMRGHDRHQGAVHHAEM
jgi:hypothetical protein